MAYLKASFPDLPAGSEERWRRIATHAFREDAGYVVNDWDPAIARALAQAVRETGDLWPLFRALARVPVLALRGETSQVLGAETLERMARELRGLECLTVPGVGHAPDLAAPEALPRVEAFLDMLERSRTNGPGSDPAAGEVG